MDKKFLNRIFLFVAAGVLLSLGVVGALRAARPVPQTDPVVLEEAQAEMVMLRVVAGLSVADVAEIVGRSPERWPWPSIGH